MARFLVCLNPKSKEVLDCIVRMGIQANMVSESRVENKYTEDPAC